MLWDTGEVLGSVLFYRDLIGWILVAALPLLVVGWWVERRRHHTPVERCVDWTPASPRAALAAAGVALGAQFPLLIAMSFFVSPNAAIPADAAAHVRIATSIIEHGLERGWVDCTCTGFPFAVHYPPGATLALAAIIALGVDPIAAVNGLGLGATIVVPPLYAYLSSRGGAHPLAAVGGALFLSWVSPLYAYAGQWTIYLGEGRLTQVVAMPVLVLLAGSILVPDRRWGWSIPPLAAAFVLCHSNLAVVVFAVAAPACWLASRTVRRRWAVAAVCATVTAVALHAPGLVEFGVPFGFPSAGAHRVGVPPHLFIDALLQGSMLDRGRSPLFTAVGAVALAHCALVWRDSRLRAAAVFVATVLGAAWVGALLPQSSWGASLVKFLSPRRVLVVFPAALALTVTFASHDRMRRLAETLPPTRAQWAPLLFGLLVPLSFSFVALPDRAEWVRDRVRNDVSHRLSDSQRALLTRWMKSVRGGRLAVDPQAFPNLLPILMGTDLSSSVPTVNCLGGPGAHVGEVARITSKADFGGADGARLAEGLGARWLLTSARTPEGGGWERVRQSDDFALMRRTQGTDFFAVGCVRTVWSGSDDALRDRLRQLPSPHPLFDPQDLIQLETSDGSWLETRRSLPECHPALARIQETNQRPGGFEATVDTPTPAHLVLRTTAFRTWRLDADGLELPLFRIAPGFLAASISAGRHHVVATTTPPRIHRWFALFVVGLVLASWWARRVA